MPRASDIDVDLLADKSLEEIREELIKIAAWRKYNSAELIEPYDKQREFFATGKNFTERMLIAGNQLGKSFAGAYETAFHLTGLYPDWWEGRRWDRPTNGWVAAEGALLTRNGPQALIFGPPGDEEGEGSAMVPRHLILSHNASHGVSDAFDIARVRHVSGGVSSVSFKSYDQGRAKFQAATLDWVWLDEEPPEDVYIESLARITATNGMVYLTFTPLRGLSQVVRRFLYEPSPHRAWVKYGVSHAKHLSPADIEQLLERYPTHQRKARLEGEPMLGAGAIFGEIPEANYICPGDTFVPLHWTKLWGIDFGINHPFGAVLTAWDRDTDVLYVLDTIKLKDALPLQHADAIKRRGPDIPVAWPHDGHKREHGTGDSIISYYKRQGLRTLPSHASWPDGGYSTEAAVMEVRERMSAGRLKICHHLADLFQEIRLYHRDEKTGMIVKEFDDLLSGLYKAIMAKRFGRPVPIGPAIPNVHSARTATVMRRARNMDVALSGF